MARYLARRLLFILMIVVIVSAIIFAITQLLPGDVAQMVLGRFATETALENLREDLGLNRPTYIQYLDWLTGFFRGDWGNSLVSRLPVLPMVMKRLGNSAVLALMALILFTATGITLGVIAALNKNKFIDQLITFISMSFVGLPEFVSGLFLITVFAISLGWFPSSSAIDPDCGFWEALPFLVLPAVTVSFTSLGYVARMTRAGTIDVLRTNYVMAAHLKGLPRRKIMFRHVLRNALLPTITVIAFNIGWLLGGLIVTEVVYSYPGLGRLLVYAIERRDLPLIQACSMVIVIVIVFANLAADIVYSWLNPRIRYGK